LVIHELTPEKTSLEAAFMELTREETEYRATTPAGDPFTDIDQPERIAA
jgi:hypothetical protein